MTHALPLWRLIRSQNFRDPDKLADFLNLPDSARQFLLKKSRFPLNLPIRLAEKIEKKTLDDPILRQFLPVEQELESDEQFTPDPVSDASFRKEPKLIRKYQGRALLLTSSACALHCRYCFRQNFDYETERKGFAEEIETIRRDPSLSEIILSGGDPLSLETRELALLFGELSKIPHIKRIRIHTRFPVGIPERIDPDFLACLQEIPKQLFFAVHTNHPNELDEDLFLALKKIIKLGIPVLNQTVLLAKVNNSVPVLETLFSRLADNGVIPYYLHRLDPVTGSARFFVSAEEGKELMRDLSCRLSGYALPKYVEEIPGASSKTPIFY